VAVDWEFQTQDTPFEARRQRVAGPACRGKVIMSYLGKVEMSY
jgi:hypothetical protein